MVAAAVSARAVPARKARSARPRFCRRCLPRLFIGPPEASQLRPMVRVLTKGAGGVARRGMLRQSRAARHEDPANMRKMVRHGHSVRPERHIRGIPSVIRAL